MSDPRPVRDILDLQQDQISRLRAELEEVKARLRLVERQLGWDPAALEFPEDVPVTGTGRAESPPSPRS